MGVNGVTKRPDIVAVTDATDHIHHVEAHRRGADIPAPDVISPADRHAGAGVRLAAVAATVLQRTGAPVVIPFTLSVGGKTADVHIDEITAKEHPSVRIRCIHLQHGGVRFQVGVTTGAARSPVIVLKGDVKILLAIEICRVAAHTALQPVIFLIVTGQTGKGVVILRTRRRHTGCDHRVFVGFQRLLWLARLRFKPCTITQYHRTFHRRRLRFCLRDQLVKRLLRRCGIAKLRLYQRHAPLCIQRGIVSGGQFRQLAACRRFVAGGDIHFCQAKNGINVSWLPRQDILIRRAGSGVITSLLCPVGQGEVNARGRRLLAQHRFRFCLFTAFTQAAGGFQYLIALQAVCQFLNIAVPLRARQAVDMRQRGSVLVMTGKIQPVSVNLLRVVRLLLRQAAH